MSGLFSAGTKLFRNLSPDKQHKVFQAAVHEFASKGYRNASMNSLVKAAGISKGSLFLYFGSKQHLFNSVVEFATSLVKDYLRHVREETKDLDIFQRLEQLLRAGFRFIDGHPHLARIYFHLLHSGEAPFGAQRILELRRQAEEFLSELLRAAASRGQIRSDIDVERTAFLVNAMFEKLLRAYHTEFLASGAGLYRGHPKELDEWITATLDMLKHGMASDQSSGTRDTQVVSRTVLCSPE